ncbi:MAG: hypothetical protein ACRBBW_17845 [Cellvibrionaceae bacterium]
MLESSFLAWCYYLIGVLGLFAFWWRLTRGITILKLQRSLRAGMMAMLICPFSIADGYSDMAPAFLMMAMETVFEGPEAFLRVGPTLLVVLALSIVAALIWDSFLGRRAKQRAQEAELNQVHDELLAQSQPDDDSAEGSSESSVVIEKPA